MTDRHIQNYNIDNPWKNGVAHFVFLQQTDKQDSYYYKDFTFDLEIIFRKLHSWANTPFTRTVFSINSSKALNNHVCFITGYTYLFTFFLHQCFGEEVSTFLKMAKRMQYFQVILTNYAKELLKSVIVYHYLRYEKQFFLRWEVPFKIFLLKKKIS